MSDTRFRCSKVKVIALFSLIIPFLLILLGLGLHMGFSRAFFLFLSPTRSIVSVAQAENFLVFWYDLVAG